MRMLVVCLFASVGLGACADRMWPAWLPAPITDDPEAQAIMGGIEPASPYLLKPYRPRRPWRWTTTYEQARPIGRMSDRRFDPDLVSQKLEDGVERRSLKDASNGADRGP